MLNVADFSNGAEIGNKIQSAYTFWPRLKGLLGQRSLAEGEGLLLHPCSSVHCLGMRFAIDVIFLDGDYRVLDIREDLRPGKMASCKGAQYVLEIPSGQTKLKSICIGDQLLISKIS